MFTVLNTRKNSFDYHTLQLVTCDYYMVDVTVSEIQHNIVGTHYWKIKYAFQYVPYSKEKQKDFDVQLHHHPFYGSTLEDYQFYTKNYHDKLPLTTMMVNHLLMNDQEISSVCGKLTIHEYRKQLMWELLNW